MARHDSFTLDAETRERIVALLPFYGHNKSGMIREAVAILHRQHFPAPAEPWVIGHDSFTAARDLVCADCGSLIPAGGTAWREVWNDGRPGAIVCRKEVEE